MTAAVQQKTRKFFDQLVQLSDVSLPTNNRMSVNTNKCHLSISKVERSTTNGEPID